ncbi:MAG: endonuclease III domain-containing protein [bacterium]
MIDTEFLISVYNAMYAAAGARGWWPGRTRFEVVVGAILTQNTAWGNVEKAIRNLRGAGVLSPRAMVRLTEEELAELIRPSGYYRVKARRLMNFMRLLDEKYGCSLDRLFRLDVPQLRQVLLGVSGIGKETADSIILYAAGKPIFVVDAYTRRIFARHRWCSENASYDELQELFMSHLLHDVPIFNEYHALLVYVGKHFCGTRSPRCTECPLKDF